MKKIQEFYLRLLKDDKEKKEFNEILKGRDIVEATDEQLLELGKISERMGYKFSLEEVRSYLGFEDRKLSEEDLDSVAGGKAPEVHLHYIRCEIGGDAEPSK